MASQTFKLVVYLKRKADITYEDFHEHWSEKHASLLLSTAIVQKNVLKYTQYHFNRPLMTKAGQQGFPLMDNFDGAAEFVGKDLNSLMEIFDDPEYVEKVEADGKNFLDTDASVLSFGHDEVKLDRP